MSTSDSGAVNSSASVGTPAPADVNDALEALVSRYIGAINAGDADTSVACYALPYFDVSNINGAPVVQMVMTEEECRHYFTQHPDQVEADKPVTVSYSDVHGFMLASNIALCVATVTRHRGNGSRIDTHINTYTTVRTDADGWRFVGYVTDYPRTTPAWTAEQPS